jgi:hypothetical protein
VPQKRYIVYPQGGGVPTPPSYNPATDVTRFLRRRQVYLAQEMQAFQRRSLLLNVGTTAPPIGGFGYPILGSYDIGNPRSYYSSTAFQQRCAQNLVTTINPGDGGDGNFGIDCATTCQNIKAINPNAKIVSYFDWFYWDTAYLNASLVTRFTNNKWFVLTAYPGGTIVSPGSTGGAPINIVNPIAGGPTDAATGYTENVWTPRYVLDYQVNGGAAGLAYGTNFPNPYLDGSLFDDTQCIQPILGDWQRTGSSGYISNTPQLMQAGYVAQYGTLRSLRPGHLCASNINVGNIPASVNIVPMNGSLDFALQEAITGGGFSWETQVGIGSITIPQLVTYLQYYTSMLNSTGFLMFGAINLTTNGEDPLTYSADQSTITAWSPAYQGARHALALSLVCTNGAFTPNGRDTTLGTSSGTNYNPSTAVWFDYWKVNIANGQAYPYSSVETNPALGAGYLGPPLGPPVTTPQGNGTYLRQFQNGIVIWNPRGNGPITNMSLGSTMQIPLSAQDPKFNGAFVTTISLADRDGIVLLN